MALLTQAEFEAALAADVCDTEALAERVLEAAEAGELWAAREVLDTVLGPAPIVVEVGRQRIAVPNE